MSVDMVKLYEDDSKILAFYDARLVNKRIWSMKLNIKKCKAMHNGKTNRKFSYCLSDTTSNSRHVLEVVEIERDLGVVVSNDLK
jgi:hypothetical protein